MDFETKAEWLLIIYALNENRGICGGYLTIQEGWQKLMNDNIWTGDGPEEAMTALHYLAQDGLVAVESDVPYDEDSNGYFPTSIKITEQGKEVIDKMLNELTLEKMHPVVKKFCEKLNSFECEVNLLCNAVPSLKTIFEKLAKKL